MARRDDIVVVTYFFFSSGFAAPNYKYHSMTIIHRKNKYLFWKIQYHYLLSELYF